MNAPTNEKPALKLRMRVTQGELIAVGPGKIALLEALEETRSISAAAKALGMSYRRAWMLIDELNRSLKNPAVASAIGGKSGGGSELTETGRQLIALYRGIEAQAVQACQPDIRKLLKLLAR
ncbi:MAG TPA: LysR family transcriptional regulator [Burkholderiaceae bacterium]|jgi:molybdate transport system regulatory protein